MLLQIKVNIHITRRSKYETAEDTSTVAAWLARYSMVTV
jgi:hypothetical protein